MASNASSLKEPDWSSGEDGGLQNKSVKPPSPESNEGMVLTPNCQCEHCHHWTNSATWSPTSELEFYSPDFYKKTYNKPDPLLKNPKFIENNKATIARMSIKHYSKVQRQTVSNILVHR